MAATDATGQIGALRSARLQRSIEDARATWNKVWKNVGVIGGVGPHNIDLLVGMVAAIGGFDRLLSFGSQTLHPFFIVELMKQFGVEVPPTVATLHDNQAILRAIVGEAPASVTPYGLLEGTPPGGSFILQASNNINAGFSAELLLEVANRNSQPRNPQLWVDTIRLQSARMQPWPLEVSPHPDPEASVLAFFAREANGTQSRIYRGLLNRWGVRPLYPRR